MHCRSQSGPFDLRGGPFDVWQRGPGPGPPWPGQQTGDLVRDPDKWWPCIHQSLPIRPHGDYWGETIEGSHTNIRITHCPHLPRDDWSDLSPGWSCHETWEAEVRGQESDERCLPWLKSPALLDDQHHGGGDTAKDEDHGEDGPDEDNHHSVTVPRLAPVLVALQTLKISKCGKKNILRWN